MSTEFIGISQEGHVLILTSGLFDYFSLLIQIYGRRYVIISRVANGASPGDRLGPFHTFTVVDIRLTLGDSLNPLPFTNKCCDLFGHSTTCGGTYVLPRKAEFHKSDFVNIVYDCLMVP